MKPTVMTNTAASASAGGGPGNVPHAPGATATNGITIPINHQYGAQQAQQQPQPQQQPYAQQQQQPGVYGSPSGNRQYPAHFQQGFGFEPDMDDMFSRSRIGRMHDPFFTTRKRCGNEPHATGTDGFSHYFHDDPDFAFPQFGTLGRRRAAAGAAPIDPHANIGHDEHDFFNRLPSEFRQYIPEGFGHTRRSAPAHPPNMTTPQSQAYYAHPQQHQHQHYVEPNQTHVATPQSPSKKLCDAAIQTEDPSTGGHEPGAKQETDQLNQHGLRNTFDMGVKSVPEGEDHGMRAHSAPPNEQQQQQQNLNGKRPTPPPASHQYGTQTSPQVGQQAPFQKVYYPPQQQGHPQQKQQTPPPPQTPGGTYIRTIPIFVEGRSEPIINSHKEIPNQYATPTGTTASTTARTNVPHSQQPQQQQQHHYQPQQNYTQHQQHHPQQQQQQHRPTPLNTQQQEAPAGAPTNAAAGVPPQTPHTLDSINKIQDIQRDVLDLMSKVERFAGKRQDKEYAYLDEMLTRNLLKLDTIDTNGKDSIRLARKEAIKCIQASINVLEAKAEENARVAAETVSETSAEEQPSEGENDLKASNGQLDVTKEAEMKSSEANHSVTPEEVQQPVDATKIQEPIPLPAPEGMQQIDNEEQQPAEVAAEVTQEQTATTTSPDTQQSTTSAETKSE